MALTMIVQKLQNIFMHLLKYFKIKILLTSSLTCALFLLFQLFIVKNCVKDFHLVLTKCFTDENFPNYSNLL